jgi:hypothetical protein
MDYGRIKEFIDCDIAEFRNWLFEYSCRYLKATKRPLTGDEIINRMDAKYLEIEQHCMEITEDCNGIEAKIDFPMSELNKSVSQDIKKKEKLLKK